MADNNLAVRITADVTDLQVKFAVAQAQVRGLTTEMNKLATASAKGIIDPEGSARLQQVAGDLLHARGETANLSTALGQAGVVVGGFGGQMQGAQVHVATTAREMRRLFTEVSRGSAGGAEVTLLRLGQHLLGLGPAALIGVAAVAALAAGLAYLIYEAISASNALDKIAIGAQFTGNLDLTREKIKEFTDVMSESADISSKDARKIADALVRIPDMTAPQMQALAHMMGTLVTESGIAADKIDGEIKRMFSGDTSAEKMVRALGGVTEAQINAAKAADESGNANLVASVKLEALKASLDRGSGAIAEHNSGMTASIKNYLLSVGAILGESGAEETHTAILEQQNKVLADHNKIIEASIALERATKPTGEQTLKTGVEVADKENPISKQIDEAKAKIKEMDAALLVAKADGDQVDIKLLNSSLTKARENLSALQFGPVLERMRADMAQVASSWDGTQSGMLEKQRQIAAQVLGEVRKGSKEYLAVRTEMAHLDVQIRQTSGNEIIANVRLQNSVINGEVTLSATQRLERERDAWAGIIGNDRLTTTQRLEVQREFNQASATLAKELEAQKQAIARSDADTNIAIAKLGVEAEKQALDEKLQLNKVSAQRKYEILKDLTQRDYTLDLEQLDNERSTLIAGTAVYQENLNKRRELAAKLSLDLAQLDRQRAVDAKKAADAEYSAWKTAVGEIETAESTMIGDIMSHRKTFAQSLTSVMQTMVQKEIENDVKAMTTRILLSNTEEAAKKATEQGGFLYHMMVGQQKVVADAANAAKSTATVAAGANSQTAATTAGQATETAATTAGAAARTEAQTAADATAATAAATAGLVQIKIDAGVAAAGAGASVAAIPLTGWAMVPEVEAATYATTMAYAAGVALDVGAWEIPRTMQGTLHAGESVVPRDFASGMRGALAGSDNGGSRRRGSVQGPIKLQVDRSAMRMTMGDYLMGYLAAVQAGARG
jgi:hypothetical protein